MNKPLSPRYLSTAAAFGVVAVFVLIASPAFAQLPTVSEIVPPQCQLGRSNVATTCTVCHLLIVISNLVNFFIWTIALPISIALVAIGGIMLLIGGDSPSRLQIGKRILWNTLIGILIVFLAWLIVDTVIKIATGAFTTGAGTAQLVSEWGPWNSIRNPSNCPL